jgi:hypothetical protein
VCPELAGVRVDEARCHAQPLGDLANIYKQPRDAHFVDSFGIAISMTSPSVP